MGGASDALVDKEKSNLAEKLAPMAGSDYHAQGLMRANLFVVFMVMTLSFSGLGVCATCWSLFYARNLDALAHICGLSASGLWPIYLVFFVMRLCHTVVSANVATLRRACGCNKPEQFVYKVIVTDKDEAEKKVVMDSAGLIGEFNRAESGVRQIRETLPFAFAAFLLVSLAFPRHACLYMACLTVMRMKSAIDFTGQANKRATGGLWAGVFQGLLDGTVLTIGLYALYLPDTTEACSIRAGYENVTGTLTDRWVVGM